MGCFPTFSMLILCRTMTSCVPTIAVWLVISSRSVDECIVQCTGGYFELWHYLNIWSKMALSQVAVILSIAFPSYHSGCKACSDELILFFTTSIIIDSDHHVLTTSGKCSGVEPVKQSRPARASPANVGRSRPGPSFENVLADADRDVQLALSSLQSPSDARVRYTPTGRACHHLLDTSHHSCC